MVLPNLPAFRRGEYQPRDNDERLALLAAQLASCVFEGLHGAAARLYSDAFAAEPKLAEDVLAATRYHAACAAALAGCGRGNDAADLGELERKRWRDRAREWLRADLAAWTKTLDDGPEADRVLVGERLAHLWSDLDLAGLRDQDSLDKLPQAERQKFRALWGAIDALIRRAQALK
jgi:serine/threonine-protein kinase